MSFTTMAKQEIMRLKIPELEPYIVSDEDIKLTGKEIGRGSYGSVEEVEIPGAVCAAKKLHDGLIEFGSDYQVHQWVTSFVNECKLASKLRHPNIVQFLGVCYLPGSHLPVLLMEKLLTSLHDLLEENKDIPFDIKVSILIGVDCGLVFLHSRVPPIAHRDLSARNILLDSALTAKIADLGVARMVNIQPGKLAATMTQGPGNIIYMPPEAVGKEGTKYNTAIDVFSFGNVALFTLTQVFQDNLLAASYFNPATHTLVARTEIERRVEYINILNQVFKKDHPLVQLVLHCLEYLPKDRPSASEVLERLKEVQSHTNQEWDIMKLELVRTAENVRTQLSTEEHAKELSEKLILFEEKQKEIDLLKGEISQQDGQINLLEKELSQLHESVNQLQGTFTQNDKQVNKLHEDVALLQVSLNEKQKQFEGLLEQRRVQKEQLDDQSIKIEQQQIPVLEVARHRKKEPKSRPTTKQAYSTFFDWRTCDSQFGDYVKRGIFICDRWHRVCPVVPRLLVTINKTVYAKGPDQQICGYTPEKDHFEILSTYCDEYYTLATLNHRVVLVTGYFGNDTWKSRMPSSVMVWNNLTLQWDDPYPECPLNSLCYPAVVAYKNYLIVAGGMKMSDLNGHDYSNGVSVLDSENGKWSLGILPVVDNYNPVVIDDTLYLVGCEHRNVLRTYLTTPVGQLFDWELLPPVPVSNHSSVVANGNILTFGEDSVHLFSPQTNKWTRVGDFLPGCLACVLLSSGEILAVGEDFMKIAKLNFRMELQENVSSIKKSLWSSFRFKRK